MRINKILAKDMKAFFRDFRSFILLFLTPVMLVLVIGLSFLGTNPSNVKITICTIESNEIDAYIENTLQNSKLFVVEKVMQPDVESCRNIIKQKIQTSSARAGVIIPKKTEYSTTKLELIVDNSKLVSDYIKSYFRIITNDISQKITKGYVDLLFTNIDEVRSSLDEVEESLTEEKRSIVSIKGSLTSARSSLYRMRTNIESARSKLDSAETAIDLSIQGLNITSFRISDSINRIDSAISVANYANVSQYEKNLIINELSNARSNLQNANSSVTGARSSLSGTKSTIKEAKNLLNPTELDGPISTLDSAISSLENSERNADFALQKISVLKTAIQDANLTRPETVQFVDSDIRDFFSTSKFIDFLFPSTVIMVIMIISTFLASITFIRQRSVGLLHRVSLAPHGHSMIIAERLLFIMVLSIITFPFIMIAGVLGLNITLNFYNTIGLFLATVVTSMIFGSIGLIIASISKYESTAILLSVFITLPMIFLSGILTPLEKLPPYIAAITNVLPLNIALKVFEGLTFYSIDHSLVAIYFGLLVFYLLAFSIAAWFFIKKEFNG